MERQFFRVRIGPQQPPSTRIDHVLVGDPDCLMASEEGLAAIQNVDEVELPSFRAPVIYVHARIPPCDTLGHKADSWNVDKPDFTCSMFCCTKGDVFIIRLLTQDDEKFAESFWRPDRPMASVYSKRFMTLTGFMLFSHVQMHDTHSLQHGQADHQAGT